MKYIGIDPSTKTGLVILDEDGTVLLEKEIISIVTNDPHRFVDISNSILKNLDFDSVICIEGFSFGSKGQALSTQYGIGWLIRSDLFRAGMKYIDIPPTNLKKFATGKGNVAKDALVLPIYKKWNYEHSSDNVRDAYVLAQMARAIDGKSELTAYQNEALKKIGS